MLPGLQPLQHRGLGVPDGPPYFDVRRPVAAHPRFSQPGFADAEHLRCRARCQQRINRVYLCNGIHVASTPWTLMEALSASSAAKFGASSRKMGGSQYGYSWGPL